MATIASQPAFCMPMTTLEGLVELIASVRAAARSYLAQRRNKANFRTPSRLDRDGGAPSRCVHENAYLRSLSERHSYLAPQYPLS